MRTALVAMALALAVTGCKKDEARRAPAADRPAMPAPERQRGVDACTALVERLCACAATKPALAEQCELKKAKPEALTLALGVADDPASTRESALQAVNEARKIIARCIEETAQLPSLGCN